MPIYHKKIEARILHIRGLGHIAIGALRAVHCGRCAVAVAKGALMDDMGALRFVGV